MEEKSISGELKNMDHDELVNLFLKLRSINFKLAERNSILESQILELTDLDKLIDELEDT